MKSLAVVVRMTESEKKGDVEYACPKLDEAFEWSKEHEKDLNEGERFDIYYRAEEEDK